jgi:hypothetical protein
MSWPKPVQRPHRRCGSAGLGEKVLDRVLRYGDGWFRTRATRTATGSASGSPTCAGAARRPGAGASRYRVRHVAIDAAVVEAVRQRGRRPGAVHAAVGEAREVERARGRGGGARRARPR